MATAATGDLAASSTPATVDQGHANRWRILAVLAAVAFMAQLDLFIVNIAVPAIGRSFGGSLTGLSWVLNAYAIVFAALLVPAGRLADHFGRRRFLLVGVTVVRRVRRHQPAAGRGARGCVRHRSPSSPATAGADGCDASSRNGPFDIPVVILVR